MARNPLGPSMFGRRGQMPVSRNQFPPNRRGFQQQAPRSNGGLPGMLQKILIRGGRGAQATAKAALPAATSSAGKLSLLDMLNHTQNALKAAESFMPMVQEYGPMMKNLPSMLRMMKALKEIDFDEEEEEAAPPETKKEKEKMEQENKKRNAAKKEEKKSSEPKEKKSNSGESLPKLFI